METNQAVIILSALAQDKRLEIFRLMVQAGPEGLSVGEIGKTVGLPGATLSFHLKELNHAGLVEKRQEGRYFFYSPNFNAINRLVAFLTDNCCQSSPCAPVSSDSSGCATKNLSQKEEITP